MFDFYKKNSFILIMLFMFILSGCGGDGSSAIEPPSTPTPSDYTGNIIADTLWRGEITVYNSIVVEKGNTLTLAPGTKVKFKHYRGYREPEKRVSLIVLGTLIVEGTKEDPVYFTSDAPDPRNGDWSAINLLYPESQCKFNYAVFECAQQGLNVYNGDVLISNCVFRWNNREGVCFESSSAFEASLAYTQIYENGYNGLAALKYELAMDYCDIWRNGTKGVRLDATELKITRSIVHENQADGLFVNNNGYLLNMGVNIYDNKDWGIGYGYGTNKIEISNMTFNNNGSGEIEGPYDDVLSAFYPPSQVDIGFTPDMSYAPGYIPGDPLLDPYMYVYPDDETRRIVKKIGDGLGLTSSLAWDGSNIWTASPGGKIYKLNPDTGEVLKEFNSPVAQPWGMTFDGENLWLLDFALKRVSKVNPHTGEELYSFKPPSVCKGIAWDGINLNLMGWPSSVIYRMDRQGNLIDTIPLKTGSGGLAWDGTYFWVPGAGRIYRYDTAGNLAGWIYAASDGTRALCWDGNYLWAAQSTNENWQDAKIFAIEILFLL